MSIQTELLAAPKVPLRHLVRFNPRPTATKSDESCYLPMEAISAFGAVDSSRRRPTSELAHGYTFLADGDVAYAKVTPCFENGKGLRATALPEGHAFATTEITVMRPSSLLDSRYLAWTLQSEDFRAPGEAHMSGAGGLKRVPESYAARFRIRRPSIAVQRAIADYLDRETAQIDAFIAKNEELITLLTERRAAAISYCVLRGLRADSELAATGQAWLGEIPVHWNVVPWKAVFRERRRRAYPADVHLTPSQRHGVLPQTDYMRLTGTRVVLNLTAPSDMKHVEPNDFVSHLRSFQGGLELSAVSGKVSMAYSVFRPLGDLLPAYSRYLLKCGRFVEALQTTTDQLRDGQSIRAKELSILRYPVPPAAEQIEIAGYLDEVTERVDSAVETAQRSMMLASERRAALISAAVTGKIDVGVAA